MIDVNTTFKLGLNNYPANGMTRTVKSVLRLEPQGVQPGSLDVVFVVDCSGSMYSVIDTIRRALKSVHNSLGPNDRVGIVGYSDDAFQVVPLVSPREFPNHFGAIDSKIRDLYETHADKGLEMAKQMLASSTATTQLIILKTDGAETDKEAGEDRAAAVIDGSGIHIIPVTLDPSVPQRFFDKMIAVGPDPLVPIMPAQAIAGGDSKALAALPSKIVDEVRQIVGEDVVIRVELAGFADLQNAYQLSPTPRAIELLPDQDGYILKVSGPLHATGMDIYLEAEYECPEEEDAPVSSPFLNVLSMAWKEVASGQLVDTEIDPVEIDFVEPSQADKQVDPALLDIFRMVMIQQHIDNGLRLAQIGSVTESIAALSQASSLAAKATNAPDLQALIQNMKDQVADGSLSAMAVLQSVAAGSVATMKALNDLSK